VSRAVITSVRLTPVFRSESTRGNVSVVFRDGPERVADPRWLADDNVAELANAARLKARGLCQSE